MAGKFKVKKITTFQEIVDNPGITLEEADLTLSDDVNIIQFKYETEEQIKRVTAESGIFTLMKTATGVKLIETELQSKQLLESIDNTSRIFKEVRVFVDRLLVYEELNVPKKRGVLLYSQPGLGKSSSIAKVCNRLVTEDSGTCVIVWPTSEVSSRDVCPFFTHQLDYAPEITKVILVIEDIGGEESDNGPKGIPASLLNLLDGVGVTFSKPTFIIATTNYPEALLGALADRPGRFDELIELPPPSLSERIQLVEFIAKRNLTDEEKTSLALKGTEGFSIAHLHEIVIRSRLHDKTIETVVKELIAHTKKYNKGFAKKAGSMGLLRDDDY